MNFTTLTFIGFLFFAFSAYWIIKERIYQNLFLTFVSYIFYGWWDYRFCLLLLLSSSADYWIGIRINKASNKFRRKLLLLLSLLFNLGLLFYFKYWNFFMESLSSSLSALGGKLDFATINIILPVGISFYTFQTLSYTIDIYKNKIQPTKSYIDYLAYVSFFPQLVAGPIERAQHLLPQFINPRTFDFSIASDGCRQILWGLAKKMLIADNLAFMVDRVYNDPVNFSGPQLMLATAFFAFQIYCDFSAYSDIAIGTAKLFGFDLMRNFAYPYFSQSMAEFWRRWHISLSTWLRDYVYIPLGGSRVNSFRRSLNVMVTFLISGLWHGAAWNYVAWGGLHGGVILLERLWIPQKTLKQSDTPCGVGILPDFPILLRTAVTFALTCFTWIFFRSKSIQDALFIVKQIFLDIVNPASYKSLGAVLIGSPIGRWIIIVLVCFVLIEWLQREHIHPLYSLKLSRNIRWLLYTLLLWITLLFGTWSSGQFVYFQF